MPALSPQLPGTRSRQQSVVRTHSPSGAGEQGRVLARHKHRAPRGPGAAIRQRPARGPRGSAGASAHPVPSGRPLRNARGPAAPRPGRQGRARAAATLRHHAPAVAARRTVRRCVLTLRRNASA